MNHSSTSYILGAAAAAMMGMAKTGLPGVSILAVMAIAEAFPGDAKSSVGAIMPAIIVGDLIAVFWFRRQADWRKIVGLLPFVAIGMACGTALLSFTSGKALGPILGWMVLGFLALEVWRQCFRWGAIPHHWFFSAMVGAVAGFGTMIGNAAGPLMTIFFISRGMQKQELIGTAAWFFLRRELEQTARDDGAQHDQSRHVKRFGFMIACFVPLGSMAGAWVLRMVSQDARSTFSH